MSQSTNDVYPTALKVATYFGIFHLAWISTAHC
jgi:aspartate ammonia-lyase